ncbi:CgeB family protein [Staphylospora marina]|uniref:CgeB family protein n=1 Tax=Staphylospora marina TaxID=2490858 RepID=UPI0013DDA506|nr:glycosyltransferase [Staphylospora marina]
MRVVFVPSSVRKPFGFIDRSVMTALRRRGCRVRLLSPSDSPERDWKKIMKRWRPQLLLVMLGVRLSPVFLEWLQTVRVPRAVWFTDDPYAIDVSLRICHAFDWVFTNESAAVPVYRSFGVSRVHHLPLAAPVPAYSPVARIKKVYRSQLVMVGSAFRNRVSAIRRLGPFLRNYQVKLVGPGWNIVNGQSGIRVRNEWVKPEEARQYYNGADIVLNFHRWHKDPHLKQNRRGVRADTPNNRTFEIAACRAFQLLDYRPDLDRFFEPGKEIVSFRTSEEFKELVRFYLPRERLRREIAEKAYRRTMAEHLYEHRIDILLDTVFS